MRYGKAKGVRRTNNRSFFNFTKLCKNCHIFPGWGLTETGSLTTELKKLPYEVVSDSQCKEVYGASIKPGMMCTGRAPMTEKHAAPGDSG